MPSPRRAAAAGFAEVVVSPERSESSSAGVAAMEIELGRDIRVRAPKDLASAIIKALVAR